MITRLKEQCHEIFDNFNIKKLYMNGQKRFNEIFRFLEDIRNKRVSAYEYADTLTLEEQSGEKVLACINVFNSNILIS